MMTRDADDVIDFADEKDHAVFEEHFLEGHLAIAVIAARPGGPGIATGIATGAASGNDRRAGEPAVSKRAPSSRSNADRSGWVRS